MAQVGFLRPDLSEVAIERSTECLALSIGCNARRAFLTALGVIARLTARPGWAARRTPRGISDRVKKPKLTTPNGHKLMRIVRLALRCLANAAACE